MISCQKNTEPTPEFATINRGFNSVFVPNKLSVGLVVPLETYAHSPVPSMEHNLSRVQLAESLGFSAVWLRDVPFNVATFGDAGQVYDPFVYLGLLAGQTRAIALGVASIVLPLRHPAHVAKAAASVDQLSGGRLILGIASGDRPEEYPAMNFSYEDRGERFRQSYEYIRKMGRTRTIIQNQYGHTDRTMDLLPKPVGGKLPLLITGSSQQSPQWLSDNGDGWMTYPRHPEMQQRVIREWRAQARVSKPVMQPLYFDLDIDRNAGPQPIHLGFRAGTRHLVKYLKAVQKAGVNHVALNLRFNREEQERTLKRLADEVLPELEQ